MTTITLTLLPTAEPALAKLRALLDEFGARHALQVDLQILEWSEAWAAYTRYATYGDGPDVSEVGSTWVSPLAAMQALRPFTLADLAPIGGVDAFHNPLWRAGFGGGAAWAVPWWVDTRLIWYWRDALESAGIAEAGAFDTHERFVATLGRLQAAGAPGWVVTTRPSAVTLQNAASWVWAYGGDILNASGDRVEIAEPAALAGLKAFFGLARFIAPELGGQTDVDSDRAFAERRAGVTVAGPWLSDTILAESGSVGLARVGMASLPGWSFVGGSSLVIWRRSLQELAAVDLIRFMNSQPFVHALARMGGGLPSRLDVLTDPGLLEDRLFRAQSASALRGRAFAGTRLWTTIETQLSDALAAIWRDVLAQPKATVTDELLLRRLQPVVKRLNNMRAT